MKNIVLLSDGTGNGAAKRNRTNVWRLYQALDLHRPDQVAFYDDGVGSQEFLPFKILGGVFGFGLKRNVIELYKFLCRNYEPGDKIYLFGFSRGAFTVRVLAGMIAFCGVYGGYEDDRDLHATARRNYSAFRSKFEWGLLNRALRFLLRAPREPVNTTKPDIELIGVWDTVDAYGLPIDELAILWDKLIVQIRFPDQKLSPKVRRAFHAVAIDDERLTFHPVLWDEGCEPDLVREGEVEPDRIEQVWFSGVHSDVGGGYPMHDLSLVTLDWMMSKAEATNPTSPGLHFIRRLRDETAKHFDWHGLQHDSRAGLAAYYRYKPRNLAQLCDDPVNDVKIERPKIHRGVMERIEASSVPYAPAGLPETYDVVATRGPVYQYEKPDQAQQRANALNAALDVVYWQRWLYYALLAVTLALVASRFLVDWVEDGVCAGTACLVDPLLGWVQDKLPDFAGGWFETLRQNPTLLWSFLVAFVLLFLAKGGLSRILVARATASWSGLKQKDAPPSWAPGLTSWLRRASQMTLRSLFGWASAIVVFLLILAAIIAVSGRVSMHVRNTLGLLCDGGADPSAVTGEIRLEPLHISDSCFATGIKLEAGETYLFLVEAHPESGETEAPQKTPWEDGEAKNGGPDGIDRTLIMRSFAPLLRHAFEPYLKLIGRIDDEGNEELAIGSGPLTYKARSTGELFLFVNDVVFGFLPDWDKPYGWEGGKNKGIAIVTVICTSCPKKETEPTSN